jgi:hypothetical protein
LRCSRPIGIRLGVDQLPLVGIPGHASFYSEVPTGPQSRKAAQDRAREGGGRGRHGQAWRCNWQRHAVAAT